MSDKESSTVTMSNKNLGSPETKKIKKNFRQSPVARSNVDIWAAQCDDCSKWRKIPTEEEYEEIPKNFLHDPFTCNKIPNMACDDLSDLKYNTECVWILDKPNIPKTPQGFKRLLVLRKDYSKMDCYYTAPNGKKFRAITEVAKFLEEHPEYKDVDLTDFSFSTPKVVSDTIPQHVAGKKRSSSQDD